MLAALELAEAAVAVGVVVDDGSFKILDCANLNESVVFGASVITSAKKKWLAFNIRIHVFTMPMISYLNHLK